MTFPQASSEALNLGQWFKLICGASYQDVAKVRNLALVYGLAGVDCVDLAADVAVVHAARQGIVVARALCPTVSPLVMVSFNDGQDPHFRKAWFDAHYCPVSCTRPCEAVCPAEAISLATPKGHQQTGLGVIAERCYGCGRCLPICPHGVLEERSLQVTVGEVMPTLLPYIDAVEIHTQVGRYIEFRDLWRQLVPYVSDLKLVAVSCPDSGARGSAVTNYLFKLYELMVPKPKQLIWQTDGRPMSGDIGKGTTHATIRMAQKVLNAGLPGYVQLAGGTNNYTVAKLRSLNLLKSDHQPEPQPHVNGVAYGSYARRLVDVGDEPLEKYPEKLCQQVSLASSLVSQIKPNIQQDSGLSKLLIDYGCQPVKDFVKLPP
ncbi:MAG: LdpA C-terminal domain-containing domain [Cyanobacteria bacterium P01_D01_bin.56]